MEPFLFVLNNCVENCYSITVTVLFSVTVWLVEMQTFSDIEIIISGQQAILKTILIQFFLNNDVFIFDSTNVLTTKTSLELVLL